METKGETVNNSDSTWKLQTTFKPLDNHLFVNNRVKSYVDNVSINENGDNLNILESTMAADFLNTVNSTIFENDDSLLTVISTTRTIVNTLGICSIIVNICFLVVMHFSKEGSSPFHRFMKNLSLTDILASLGFILIQNWPAGPFAFVYPSENFLASAWLPYIFRGMPWMFFTSYFLTLTCLSVNQYVAVCKPWKYSKIASTKMVFGGIVIVWVLSTLQIVVPGVVLLILGCVSDTKVAQENLYIISKREMQVWMGIFLVTTFVSIVLNSLIYKKIRKLKWKRRFSLTSQESLNIRMKQDAFLTITLLLVSAVLLRMPFPIVSIITLELDSNALGQKSSIIINSVLLILLYINFFTDTIIYTIRVKEARRMYKAWCTSILCCFCESGSSLWSFRPIPQQPSSVGPCSKMTDKIELSSCRSSTGENGVTTTPILNSNKNNSNHDTVKEGNDATVTV